MLYKKRLLNKKKETHNDRLLPPQEDTTSILSILSRCLCLFGIVTGLSHSKKLNKGRMGKEV